MAQRAANWVGKEGFLVREVPKASGVFALYEATVAGRNESKILISQGINEDKVVISTGMKLSDSLKFKLAGMPEQEKTRLLGELAWLLQSRPVRFNVEQAGMVPVSVSLSVPIYSDGLTKEKTMEAVSEVMRTNMLVQMQLSAYSQKVEHDRVQQAGQKVMAASMGKPMPTATQAKCPKCGNMVKVGAKFCGKCGTQFNWG
jgi:hypothetical protein